MNAADVPPLPSPHSVRVLMVTDDRGSFADGFPFSMTALVGALTEEYGPARFVITTAHRQDTHFANGADYRNFRFDLPGLNLDQFDQIWLFGVHPAGEGKDALSDAEIAAVLRFMNGGGGVFATGDHEDLGWAMCGSIPRVNSMRKWTWDPNNPDDPKASPPGDGPWRLDTLNPGHNDWFSLDDQSDDIPQRIWPRYYLRADPTGRGRWVWPHPLLSGPQGVIQVLPDHPHEGECVVPNDLTLTFPLDGVLTPEYPLGIAPEVIATSVVPPRTGANDDKGMLHGRTFGAIGAYDGHLAHVGRVVVDATWHHFFNINLTGDPNDTQQDPIKQHGFLATERGRQAFADIKTYYRNIATWLARPDAQEAMWWRTVWDLRWHHQIAMSLRHHYTTHPEALTLAELGRIGHLARTVRPDAILAQWTGRIGLGTVHPTVWDALAGQLDPWLPTDASAPPAALPPDFLHDVMLGASLYGVAAAAPTTHAVPADLDVTDLSATVEPLITRALNLVTEHIQTTTTQLSTMSTALDPERRGEQ